MKIYAFSDTHLDAKAVQIIKKRSKQADILICAGDISWFGNGLKEILTDLNRIKKDLYIIPGNHEDPPTQLKKVCEPLKYVHFVHKQTKRIGKYRFFFYGGGGFSTINKPFEKLMKIFKKTLTKDDEVILVTHAPPYKTKLDYLEWAGHIGCKSEKKFIKEIKPILHISGHIHENIGVQEVLYKKTLAINPGPAGEMIEL
ncbi:MAG: metallophosphoesterase family protein [Nanoarchaeota archaeon]|nr:metallophosphoesterase family protein [Nanoarchaeota archaeon]